MKVVHLVKDRKRGCPFGKKCDDCNLYRPVYQTPPGMEVTQKWDCQINHLVTFVAESKDRVLGVQQAVEMARNESSKRQDALLGMVNDARAIQSQ